MAIAMTTSAFCEKRAIPTRVHESGSSKELSEIDRYPIDLPIVVFYDSDTNTLEVLCDNDNIQGEVYVYDEAGTLEVYSPCMNVCLTFTTSNHHSILIKGDGWEAEGCF